MENETIPVPRKKNYIDARESLKIYRLSRLSLSSRSPFIISLWFFFCSSSLNPRLPISPGSSRALRLLLPLISRRITVSEMRSDSGEILAKIPSFILISASPGWRGPPLSAGNPVYTGSKDGLDDAPEDSPENASIPALSIVPVAPCGLSSPLTTPICSIYKESPPRSPAIFFFSPHKGWISCHPSVFCYGHFTDCLPDRDDLPTLLSLLSEQFGDGKHVFARESLVRYFIICGRLHKFLFSFISKFHLSSESFPLCSIFNFVGPCESVFDNLRNEMIRIEEISVFFI